MVEASQLLLGKIDKLVQDKSNNKFDYDNIRNICFDIDYIVVYLSNDYVNCHIDIKYSELIDDK